MKKIKSLLEESNLKTTPQSLAILKELEEKESQLYREKFGRAGLILLTNEF